MKQTYAFMHGGHIYTLQPLPASVSMPPFKWVGYCDGNRCGFFKTKKHFEEFVAREPGQGPLGPHAQATFRAETWSTWEGARALQGLHERSGIRAH